MMQRPLTLIGGFVVLSALGIVACSSADDPEGSGDTGGTGGATTGGSTATGGSGATTTGGSATTGGTAGTATGGSGATATGGSAGTPPECKGIQRDTACAMEGLSCPGLVCGLADSGTRDCNCATNWSCSSCSYVGAWTETMPADLQPCPDGVADEVACTTDHVICGPTAANEYCACWNSPSDGQTWDCDKAPTSWGL